MHPVTELRRRVREQDRAPAFTPLPRRAYVTAKFRPLPMRGRSFSDSGSLAARCAGRIGCIAGCRDHTQTNRAYLPQPLTRFAVCGRFIEGNPCMQQRCGQQETRGRATGLQPQHLPVDFVFEPVARLAGDALPLHGCSIVGLKQRRAGPSV